MAFLLRSRLSLACETSATTGFQSFQETRELVTVELPIEWARFAIGQFFVQPQALFHFIRAGKVIRRQHLGRAARSPLAPTVVATTAPSWGEVRPPRRPRHSIGWDHHGATTPTLPAETVRAAWCVVEPAADNARRNRRETGAGRTAPDRTSCDSIRRKCAAVHAECRDRNARCTQTATLQLFVK